MVELKDISDFELTQELRRRGNAVIIWNEHDVKWTAKTLFEEPVFLRKDQVKEVLRLVDSEQDASRGITWDTIIHYIDEVKNL